jgi:xanthine dehydrogenase accessory factor
VKSEKNSTTPVTATITGILRGLVRDNLYVKQGMKVGDIDPRAEREHCFTISDKSRAIAGGVLEAILYFLNKG